jgi:hypothetical protein
MGLVLSPRIEDIEGSAGICDSEIPSRRLPPMATGHGIAIGDTPAQVIRKIGLPTRASPTGRKSKQRVFTYVYRWREGICTLEHRSVYTFRRGRLWAIELYEDTIEGG